MQNELKDLLFALHNATVFVTAQKNEDGLWEMEIQIKDTYDYDEGKSEGAVGVAVDALARSQKKGLFVAYPLRIHLER